MRILILLLCSGLLVQPIFSQPSNNTCSSPIKLQYTGSCNYSTYTNDSATKSGNATSQCGITPTTDVWFEIVMPASGNLVINTSRIDEYMTMALYSGKCGSLTEYRCDNNSSKSYRMPYMAIYDPSIAGDTMLLQIWSDGSKTGRFDLCVYEPSRPSNRICDSSINLQVGNTCAFKYYNNEYAGNSGIGKPSCGNYVTNDVWFNAIVPTSGRLILRTDNNGMGDAEMAVYTGDCDSLSLLRCDQNSAPGYQQAQIYINDTSMAGEQLKIRVWRNGSIYGGGFGICAFDPQVDSNDRPHGATLLSVGASCHPQRFSNTDYTASEVAKPPCGDYRGADIWFKTVVPSSGVLVLTGDNAGIGNSAMAVYTNTPDSLIYYTCDDNSGPYYQQPQIVINDSSIANDTIYVMYWKVGSVHSSSFTICAFEPNLPPNRECATALSIKVTPSCNFQRFSNEYAGTSGDGLVTCGDYRGGDVWFECEVPSSGKITADMRPAGTNDFDMAIYTGSCGSLTPLQCDDRSSTYGGAMPRISIDDTTYRNQKVFIQVWRHANVNGANFDLCVFGDLTPEIKNKQGATVCEGESIPTLSVYNGVFQYNWYSAKNGGQLLASDTFQYYTTSAGTYYVEAVNTETGQRSTREAIDLVIHKKPIVVVDGFIEVCEGEDTSGISIVDYGATYNWYRDKALQAPFALDTNSIFPNSSSTYFVQAIDSTSGCVADLKEIEYVLNKKPLLAAYSKQLFCDNNADYLLEVVDSGLLYNWYADKDLTKLLAYNSSSYRTNLEVVHYVTATDTSTGCTSDYRTVELFILETPDVSGPSTYDVCDYQFPLEVYVKDEQHVYKWYADASKTNVLESDDAFLNVTGPGSYYVEAVSSNNCKSSLKRVVVNQRSSPNTVVPTGYVGCDYDYDGLSVQDDGYQYNWLADTFPPIVIASNTAKYKPIKSGRYFVYAKDTQTGCQSMYVAVNLELFKTRKPIITSSGDALHTGSYDTYQWYHDDIGITGATDSFIMLNQKGTYHVVVFDTNGCEVSSDEIVIDKLSNTQYLTPKGVAVYPNPTSSFVNVDAESLQIENYQVVNSQGQVVSEGMFSGYISLDDLPGGTYVLRFTSNKSVIGVPVVKLP